MPLAQVKMAMQCCAYAVLVQTLTVLALPLVLGHTPAVGADGIPEVRRGTTLQSVVAVYEAYRSG